MAASRAKSDKVAGTVCRTQALYPLEARNPCALPASWAGSATFWTHGIPGGKQGAGAMQNQPEGKAVAIALLSAGLSSFPYPLLGSRA